MEITDKTILIINFSYCIICFLFLIYILGFITFDPRIIFLLCFVIAFLIACSIQYSDENKDPKDKIIKNTYIEFLYIFVSFIFIMLFLTMLYLNFLKQALNILKLKPSIKNKIRKVFGIKKGDDDFMIDLSEMPDIKHLEVPGSRVSLFGSRNPEIIKTKITTSLFMIICLFSIPVFAINIYKINRDIKDSE